ncbi:MAG: ABC transporter ATP-binding protein [Oscillospiraceae bacterium]|nr:ABC transporter ATP-binding protein [Oscillospiraceae bacterium]
MDNVLQSAGGHETLLEIHDLHVEYDTDDAVVHALNGFDLTLRRGEKLGLVGETGAGKTTMALSVLRLLPPRVGKITQGSVTYDGIDILNASPKEMLALRGAKISMIFQDPMTSLNPVITVGDQILEVLKLHFPDMRREDRDAKVDEIMKLVGIPPSRKGEYPHQFSGGMKQRIVIAMALVSEPELLLADEPTTALDVTIQAQILELMKQLKEKFNSAMVLITHDLGVVAEFCDTVAIVYAGEVIEQGSVEDIYARKNNHPYTSGLFNCIPDLHTTADRLEPIPGFMADPTDLPQGCSFAPRCPHCTERCLNESPNMYLRGSHGIKCHRFSGEEAE